MKKIRISTVELRAALLFAEESEAALVEIESEDAGIGDTIVVFPLSGEGGWRRTGESKNVTDFDTW